MAKKLIIVGLTQTQLDGYGGKRKQMSRIPQKEACY